MMMVAGRQLFFFLLTVSVNFLVFFFFLFLTQYAVRHITIYDLNKFPIFMNEIYDKKYVLTLLYYISVYCVLRYMLVYIYIIYIYSNLFQCFSLAHTIMYTCASTLHRLKDITYICICMASGVGSFERAI